MGQDSMLASRSLSSVDLRLRTLVVLSTLLVCVACVPDTTGDKSAIAIAMVARELPSSTATGISSADLTSTGIPRGDGVLVWVKNRKASRLAWVVLDGQAYACNRDTKNLTPRVPFTFEARWDTWKQTGLDPSNPAVFLQIVDTAEAGPTPR